MVFNSTIFVLLFLLVFSIYWMVPLRGKHALIIAGTVLFYSWYSLPFFLLFLTVLSVNYRIGMSLIQRKNVGVLRLGVVLDVSLLAFFKYSYLVAGGVGRLFDVPYLVDLRAHMQADLGWQIVLPLGISFYTFQAIAFIVDCYRGAVTEPVEFRKYAVFTLFFPQFVAGPILRASDFVPQIDNPQLTPERLRKGLLLLLVGIVKKVLIADRIGAEIGGAWRDPSGYDATVHVILPLAYVMQIFADFSGYTDMARGMGKLLGYELPENFRGPLLSRSMSELWSRWHMTLSMWLRDYIYIPLGGSRRGTWRTSLNLFITMALGGLWHGATWTMLLWGGFVGTILIIERLMREAKIRLLPEHPAADVFRVGFTLLLFAVSGSLFAAPSLDQTLAVWKGIVTWQRGNPLPGMGAAVGLSILAFLFNFPGYYDGLRRQVSARPRFQLASLYAGGFVVGLLVLVYGDAGGAFLYFAF